MKEQNSWHENFIVIDTLGEGGNARVYLVEEKSTGNRLALKELYNKSPEKKTRFINEIKVARDNATDISGIIPIINFNEEEYWYTMPIADPILNHVKDSKISEIVSGVIQLSETLEKLHEKEISHRDIKPSNIYYYNNRYSFGDFGLVDFPDNPKDLTKSDKGLGAIFTIAPEMKRNPKDADGKKADVFSLAKMMWMLLSGNEKGFDGVYNYLDSSHSLRYIKKYKNTHLVELEELLKDATNNNPDSRPNIGKFKERLKEWIDIYSNYSKAQASDWNFLNKQLFGLASPESSIWKDINKIVEVLNVVGTTPAYNHMIFSDTGGLDFNYAELAAEEGCIYLHTTFDFCFVVKPKCLCYEGFGENYRWNYFLLELDKMDPIIKESDIVDYEYLVEDTPAHYVDATYVQYGVYDYDTEVPLPQGYKLVSRYLKGKFLIVMKDGPYNKISGTYDGRHGMCSSLKFREYIENSIKMYSYIRSKQDSKLNDLDDCELEKRILCLDIFNKNPFINQENYQLQNDNVENEERERRDSYIENNYYLWNFKEILDFDSYSNSKIKFCFKFKVPNDNNGMNLFDKSGKYICKDGSIKELKSPLDDDCYYTYDRIKAINLRDDIIQYINQILYQNSLYSLDKFENYILIELIKHGKPSHLFTKHEIKEEMRKADDRVNNQLVIDEDGYAKVIKNEGYGYLYPVRHESWDAGNVYVGKYSELSTLDDNYISLLQGWLSYLKTGRNQYIDYIYNNQDEEELLNEIRKYY